MRWQFAQQDGFDGDIEFSDVPGDLQVGLYFIGLFLAHAQNAEYRIVPVPNALEWFLWHPNVDVTTRIALQPVFDLN